MFYMILAIASTGCSSTASNLDTTNLDLVKENHAEIKKGSEKFILDSYIIPFERPYYVLIRNDKNTSISADVAHSIAQEYIKPRGCTTPISLRNDLDRKNSNSSQWIIGIDC